MRWAFCASHCANDCSRGLSSREHSTRRAAQNISSKSAMNWNMFAMSSAPGKPSAANCDGAIATCRTAGDNASEDLLTSILVAEQDDTQWLESQLELIAQVGEQVYLAQQL